MAEYARKHRSAPNKFDGLFWETESGQTQSPLGPLVATARAEGTVKVATDQVSPYHG
jgi:hypothetical protein